jgi:hypothetical protein
VIVVIDVGVVFIVVVVEVVFDFVFVGVVVTVLQSLSWLSWKSFLLSLLLSSGFRRSNRRYSVAVAVMVVVGVVFCCRESRF